jgi:sialate O-acetylesterase
MARADVTLAPLFADNMVLQSGMPVPVWGRADPGETVTVSFAGQVKETRAGADGKWTTRLEPLTVSSEPSEMTVKGANQIALRNVLVGEVWLCSGQSNMAMGIGEDFGGKEAIAAADKPLIRLVTVSLQAEPQPCGSPKSGRWVVCSPTTLRFSAVGYYFGRELHDRLGVPVGLIQAAVGGTTAQSWTPLDALKADPALARYVGQYAADSNTSDAEFAQRGEAARTLGVAMSERVKDPGNAKEREGWQTPGADLSAWEQVDVPVGWFQDKHIYGSIWYRRGIEVPDHWAGKDLVLKLGLVDDYDTTYFNGEKVGAIGPETPEWWLTPRLYRIPGKLVKAGENTIAVRVFNDFGSGGFYSPPMDMRLVRADDEGASVGLAGHWWRRVEEARKSFPLIPPTVIKERCNVPSFLYNGMIAPLVPFALRGVAWYQGEFNADEAYTYRRLLPAMIHGWREQWGQGAFPFYIVQLPNFHAVAKQPQESSWAELREAQALTVGNTFNTGLAVTLDIGEAGNIHPRNKHDVGVRLALVALARTYGQNVEDSGPVCKSMRMEDGALQLFFDPKGGGLVTKGAGPVKGFVICGVDRRFVWADARIENDTVRLSSPEVRNPVAARYAWATNPDCNLYGKNGLPAAPFRTDAFPGVTQPRPQRTP